jgi:hypothetical protein
VPGTDSTAFRKTEMGEQELQQAYYNPHGLREMYTRENTERRRVGSHTLRRHLTAAQDKALTAKMTKIRDEYQVANNDDVVIAFVQGLIAEGKQAEVDPKLAEIAKNAVVPKRTTPVYKS